ncbi:putative tyrosine phosphatase family protein [Peziza echinospora]|nr:putative tyrosine phosphatase family protein [Peziza echinospora]
MPAGFNKLIPPQNFAPVEDGLYRSGQPSSINLAFLRELNLKTIVWLAVEEPSESLLTFADENDLTIHHLGLQEGNNPWDPLTVDCVVDAVQQLVNKTNFPILVSCSMGRHRTGTVIGCLRRLQGWNLTSTLEEYRRFTGSRRNRAVNELMIEAFDRMAIKIPGEAEGGKPDWLWLHK